MTTSEITTIDTSILAEFAGGQQNEVAMMIGISTVKDSDAVYFQYVGNDQTPVAMVWPNTGKPVTKFQNIRLTGLSIAENIGEYEATKLNVFVETPSGKTLMLTSGLTTLWSQYLITGLSGLAMTGNLGFVFQLDTWKGTSKFKPTFAKVRSGDMAMSDPALKQGLIEAKGTKGATEAIMRDTVEYINKLVTGGDVEPAVVAELNEVTDEF
tara:strand:- start:1170 stop:1802 length:633 start_codon:yes stop_codon:yes gene_type:complete